jgi:hypothetical protein
VSFKSFAVASGLLALNVWRPRGTQCWADEVVLEFVCFSFMVKAYACCWPADISVGESALGALSSPARRSTSLLAALILTALSSCPLLQAESIQEAGETRIGPEGLKERIYFQSLSRSCC